MTLRVVDPWGLPVPGARITVAGAAITTSETGEAALAQNLPAEFEIQVESPGFQRLTRTFLRWTGTEVLQLQLGSVMDRITVTATRGERLSGETASSVTVLDSEAIRTSPARSVDDVLRQVPGFSLLRRAGSVASHPTTQGVSLRGIGPSGASRTLVLADGLPMNDPFGSWVYWNRVPKLSIDSIEVVRGGASDLYGSQALGGVIHLRTRRPAPKTFLGEISYGERAQLQGSFYTSDVRGNWGYSLSAEGFRTNGYMAVGPGQRGRADQSVTSGYRTAVAHVERRFGASTRAYSNFVLSTEDRENGTVLQRNDTNFRQVSVGGEFEHARGQTEVQLFGGSESFDSSFTTLLAARATERMDSMHRVPLGYGGAQGHTLLTFGRHTIVTGMEFRNVRGLTHETLFTNGVRSGVRKTGGTQRTFGAFLEDVVAITPRADVTWSVRWDRWRNEDIGGATAIESNWSPKLGTSVRVHPNWTVHAAAYGAFRAPTLNELYRPFQVGTALTQANSLLGDERLRGVETGVETRALGGRVHVRAGGYWTRLAGTVANITLIQTPQQTIRQRRNLGTTRSRGLETEVELRPHRLWTITAGYLLSQGVVLKYPTSPNLQGRRIPQVPRHQYSLATQGTFLGNYRVNFQARGAGRQFEDDLNSPTLRLAKLFVMDAYLARSLGRDVEVFIAGENLTDSVIEVGRNPVVNPIITLGMPRILRAGLTVRLGSR